jgi:putative NIF3 family GTP cyclohydrolase 1 type 2
MFETKMYSPHTAADGASSHGINAWLAKILSSYNNSPWLDEEDEYADQRITGVSEIVKIKEGILEKGTYLHTNPGHAIEFQQIPVVILTHNSYI